MDNELMQYLKMKDENSMNATNKFIWFLIFVIVIGFCVFLLLLIADKVEFYPQTTCIPNYLLLNLTRTITGG